jgi:hypothetical protein
MTLTKLQTLYRAAVAADPSVAVRCMDIDNDGQWCLWLEYNSVTLRLEEWQARTLIMAQTGIVENKEVCVFLERIARKEASK